MDKVACDKAVGERWCVTKLCVSDGAWKSGVCDRLCVCVANGVWQMTCDACLANLCLIDGVWPRLCLPKLCVFERCRVTKRMCDRLFMWQKFVKDGVRQRWCVTELWVRNNPKLPATALSEGEKVKLILVKHCSHGKRTKTSCETVNLLRCSTFSSFEDSAYFLQFPWGKKKALAICHLVLVPLALTKICRINGQSCMWQSCGWKMVWDRNGVWQSCGRKMLFVCQRWCMAKLGMTKCMWQRCVRKRVCVCVFVWQRYERSSGGPDRRKLCVKICCGTKNVWQTKCVTKLREKKRWDKDGVWLRWRLTKIT